MHILTFPPGTPCICIYIMFVKCFLYAGLLIIDVSPRPLFKKLIAFIWSCTFYTPLPVHICRLGSERLQTPFPSALANLTKDNISFVTCLRASVRPHGATQIPQDGFS